MQYDIIKPDGNVETIQGPDQSTVGQVMTEPAESTGFRFPFSPFTTYPIVARYAYPPNPVYPAFARAVFPVRMTLFVRSVSNTYQPHGWVPVGNIEVDAVATALSIARCMGGAIGPIGATAPTQFP
jgi:hypothetical protein